MSAALSTAPTKRKRRRVIVACLECHRRRVKCDRGEPCNACIRHGVGDSCAYEPMTNTKEANAGPSNSHEPEMPAESTAHDFFNFATGNQQPYETTNWFTQPWQNVSTSDTTTSSIRAPSPHRLSALRSSHDGSSISPPNPTEDPSPASSSSSYPQMENAPMARFLRQSQGEKVPHSNTESSSNTSPSQKEGSTYAYTREEAIRIRKACAHWPPMSRIPNMARFYFAELNCFYNIMDEDYVNAFIARRVLPLLDCKSDDEFYYRIRPGDATKLALTATMIINSALRCSAGLLALWFTSREPKGRIRDDAYTAEARDAISAQIRTSIKTLLTECMQLDGPSYDKVRATICWMETLKSEGSLAGPEAVVWFPRLTKVAEEIDLFNEPPKDVGEIEREMRRWLFVDFIACNWFGATIYGEHLRVPSEKLNTEYPSRFKNREQEVKMLRFRMGKVFGELGQVTKNGTTDWRKVDDIDEELQEYLRAIPNDLKPETAGGILNAAFKQSLLHNHTSESKAFRLQKHLLGVFYNFLRGLTHRTRFFPHPEIPEERVQHSRQICVESAKNILWLQQENRAESFSDAWVRGFHYVYITLEHAVVLILAALTTLGDAETEQQARMHDSRTATEWEGGPLQEAVTKARSLLEWSQRAADILSGLPMDVSTNIQASQFLNRLQTKANSLVDWYESYAKSSTGPRLAIFSAATATKHLLSDSDGKTLPIPMLHGNIEMTSDQSFSNEKQAKVPSKSSNESTQDPMLFLGSHAIMGNTSQNDQQGQSSSNLTPSQMLHFDNNSMSDLVYMGGLDNASFSLPRKDAEDPLSMFDAAPPLEEQIDVWLALLQQ
ncbi:uncharacterized protein FA14DRAFT_159185 [Meira miltonrushii]|uniref:Zn(2)-C6 fungal-type domain-containing protein n=1 Tax=Meira miltonrushii TaxID=1280837 RepID=A0A316VIK3_9BASI|nr:uncharacterized protein FA14DRAFT_159185 [Meira miltonrushii]PWN36878.1 hypothetical protein FA14DRAFT_159185 [Meira miltonrushii]